MKENLGAESVNSGRVSSMGPEMWWEACGIWMNAVTGEWGTAFSGEIV